MHVHLLAMHRHESYPGERGPEILAVCDEWTMDENPQWWREEIARQKALVGTDAAAWAELTLTVDSDTLMNALYPTRRPIPSTVTAATSLSEETGQARTGTVEGFTEIGYQVRFDDSLDAAEVSIHDVEPLPDHS